MQLNFKKNKYNIIIFIISFFIFSGCAEENIKKYDYQNNYKIEKTDKKINIITNRNFKNAEFEINKIIYNDQFDGVAEDVKFKIKHNIKKNKTIINIDNKSNFTKDGDTVFYIKVDKEIEAFINDLEIKLKKKSIIPSIMEKLLLYVNYVFNNFGLSIIILTLIIKLIMLPFTLKMDKSMRDMKKIQPEVDKLKEKYKDNPQLLNTEMMKLWSEHNVNPVGGCLPVFIQIPIFFALYSILKTDSLANVIPTNTTFLYFNLTMPDKFYILPILNGAVLFLQQRVMKTEEANPQMKMLQYALPGMILFISLNMPAGLQLYWLFSSAFSFLQQYYIVKMSDNNKIEKKI